MLAAAALHKSLPVMPESQGSSSPIEVNASAGTNAEDGNSL